MSNDGAVKRDLPFEDLVDAEGMNKCFNDAIEYVRRTYESGDDIETPMVLLEDGDGKMNVVMMIMDASPDESRRYAVTALRQIFHKQGGSRFSLLSEAWMLSTDDPEKMRLSMEIGVSQMPEEDRQEVFLCQTLNVGREVRSRIYVIEHDGDKKRLGPILRDDSISKTEGVFASSWFNAFE